MTPWIWLIIGGIFEACWAVTLNLSNGFGVFHWTVITILLTLVSMWFLDKGMKEGAPVGSGYAVWVGFGAVFSALFGVLFFGESLPLIGWLFFAVLIAGVLLMQLSEDQAEK